MWLTAFMVSARSMVGKRKEVEVENLQWWPELCWCWRRVVE